VKNKSKDFSKLNKLETLNMALFGLSCWGFLIAALTWFLEQRVYASIIKALGVESSPFASVFIDGSPLSPLIPLALIGGLLFWKELHWKATPLAFGLNLAFLVFSITMLWGVDSSLRGGVINFIDALSK
jgi:hypothetical protein